VLTMWGWNRAYDKLAGSSPKLFCAGVAGYGPQILVRGSGSRRSGLPQISIRQSDRGKAVS
jgi:hypothetical protein